MRGPAAKLRFISLVISSFVSRCAVDRKHCVANMWKWQGKNGLNVLETQPCFHVVDDLTISNQWWSLRLKVSCMFGWYPMSTINTFGHVWNLEPELVSLVCHVVGSTLMKPSQKSVVPPKQAHVLLRESFDVLDGEGGDILTLLSSQLRVRSCWC